MMRSAISWLVVMASAAANLPAQTPGAGKQVFDTRWAICHGEDDINTGKIAWELPQVGSGESRSGTLATAAGLVLFGEDSGALMGADSATGKPLWSFQTSQSLRASPMTYLFDNKQLVAIASGSNTLVFGLME